MISFHWTEWWWISELSDEKMTVRQDCADEMSVGGECKSPECIPVLLRWALEREKKGSTGEFHLRRRHVSDGLRWQKPAPNREPSKEKLKSIKNEWRTWAKGPRECRGLGKRSAPLELAFASNNWGICNQGLWSQIWSWFDYRVLLWQTRVSGYKQTDAKLCIMRQSMGPHTLR